MVTELLNFKVRESVMKHPVVGEFRLASSVALRAANCMHRINGIADSFIEFVPLLFRGAVSYIFSDAVHYVAPNSRNIHCNYVNMK